jgi:hypothetical protein
MKAPANLARKLLEELASDCVAVIGYIREARGIIRKKVGLYGPREVKRTSHL